MASAWCEMKCVFYDIFTVLKQLMSLTELHIYIEKGKICAFLFLSCFLDSSAPDIWHFFFFIVDCTFIPTCTCHLKKQPCFFFSSVIICVNFKKSDSYVDYFYADISREMQIEFFDSL